jgi:uncharacterized membrane protein YedE/YeeE
MRSIIYLLIGALFGITMYKSEAASWFRIYEMFQFKAFHMYGIIGSSVVLGMIVVFLIKRFNIKSFYGHEIIFNPKDMSIPRYMFGGIIFGIGWALAGACPGPMFTLIGAGYISFLIVIIGAILGTFLYGVLRSKLPH